MKVKEDIEDNSVLEIKKHIKSKNPKVTVIVPVFKVERYLAQCINSIINQTMEDIEIIIVDEGLQDRCREIIDYYESIDPRIIAPHYKNGGYGASCNLGFTMAKGEYLAIVESDDFIDPEMYEEMYDYAKSLDADVVKTPYKEYYSNGRIRNCSYRNYMREVTPSKSCFSVKEFGDLLGVHASLWAAIYKTNYMKDNNIQFVTAKGGAYVDVGFRIDTLINTDKIAWLDKPYYNYRVDSEGSTTNNFNLDKMIERWKEAHEKFSAIQDDYDKYYGKYLIFDEFLNTVGWLLNIKISKQQFESICKNLEYVKEETIKESMVLSELQKEEILMVKRNPKKAYNFFNLHRCIRLVKGYYLDAMIKIARPMHLFILSVLYLVSFVMRYLTTGWISNVSNSFAVIWLALIGIYTIDLCIYEILRICTYIKRKLTKKINITI